MNYSRIYENYAWIKVKRYEPPRHTPQEPFDYKAAYYTLLKHHEAETTFLIAEVRKLASKLDDIENR